MNVMFLHSGDDVPSARFRALPFGRRLRQAGHRCKLAASFPQKYDYFPAIGFRPSQWLKRVVRSKHLLEVYVRRFDAIVIDRELFDDETYAWEDRFRRAAKTVILDVDDGVFLRYPQKYQHLAQIADGVLAGNRAIAEYTQPFNDNITIMPTCIELQDYRVREFDDESGRPPVIGWIGTTGNLPLLNVCAPALRRLSQRTSFELRLIAGESTPLKSLDLAGVNMRFIAWQGKSEVRELSQFDVGIMPLGESDPWMRYKCGLKLLQYMSVGIPGVASPIGVNAEIVRNGENGFLASTVDEWEWALDCLAKDPLLRRRLGESARKTVEAEYSLDVHFPRFVAALEAAVQRCRQ